jgi:flagellar biosynthesis protein FliP
MGAQKDQHAVQFQNLKSQPKGREHVLKQPSKEVVSNKPVLALFVLLLMGPGLLVRVGPYVSLVIAWAILRPTAGPMEKIAIE